MKQWQTKTTVILFVFGTQAIIVTHGLEVEEDETVFWFCYLSAEIHKQQTTETAAKTQDKDMEERKVLQ